MTEQADKLVRVQAPHFTAGVIIDRDGRVIRTAPILKWSLGWHRDRLAQYFRSKGWTATIEADRQKDSPP